MEKDHFKDRTKETTLITAILENLRLSVKRKHRHMQKNYLT